MQGLLADLEQAPAGSEEKLAILRVMRMLDDASGRNKELVEQYMASRWQRAFPGQGAIQNQLMAHLNYALEHTDWHAARVAGDQAAITAFMPFKEPVYWCSARAQQITHVSASLSEPGGESGQ